MLLNVYLDEAIKSKPLFSQLAQEGDLIVFADDVLVIIKDQNELIKVIGQLKELQEGFLYG